MGGWWGGGKSRQYLWMPGFVNHTLVGGAGEGVEDLVGFVVPRQCAFSPNTEAVINNLCLVCLHCL